MKKVLTVLAICCTALSAMIVYTLKHDTRQMSRRVQQLERQLETSRTEISVLRAELGELTRPERIEQLARQKLGMLPQAPHQFAGELGSAKETPK